MTNILKTHGVSLVRVQIGRELVGLITLIDLNKFSIQMILPKHVKRFYGQLFDALSCKNIIVIFAALFA